MGAKIIAILAEKFLLKFIDWLTDWLKEKQAENAQRKKVKDEIKKIKIDPDRASRAKRLNDLINN